ncbi:MAG: hypothetical protein LEGION0398_MBIBDBAK_01164 [Legionellaceae bacterium]
MVNLAKEKNWSLSMTGHSLGGWLSQVSLIYCHLKFDYKQANTVAFDSFVVGSMFERITENFDNKRNKPKEEDFDIKTYVAAPNIINASHKKLGVRFQVFPKVDSLFKLFLGSYDDYFQSLEQDKLSALGWMGPYIYRLIKYGILGLDLIEDIKILNSITGHSMEGITDTFNPNTGFPYEVEEVNSWPHIKWPNKKTSYIEQKIEEITNIKKNAPQYVDNILDDASIFKLLGEGGFLNGLAKKIAGNAIKFVANDAWDAIFQSQLIESAEMAMSLFINPDVNKKAFRTFMLDFFVNDKKTSGSFL